ncbi:MAG: hypothetical protein AAB495_03070 [Patescibacteria group bacterium]
MFLLDFIASIWWIIVFVIFFPIARNAWMSWRQEEYKGRIPFVLLELHIPREIKKSPKGMEQIFSAIHSLRNAPGNLKEWYWEGEVTLWFTFEMVSHGGEIHFYVRTPKKHKELVEAAFFSYYPDIEITQPEEYLDSLPRNMGEVYERGYELWGTELILAKSAAYPIKTYLDFESPDEDKQYDPISAFLEVLGKAKPGEFVGIQIIVAALGPDWSVQFEGLIDSLKDRKEKMLRVKKGGGSSVGTAAEFPGGILPAFSVVKKVAEATSQEQALGRALLQRTPGETDVLKAIEENLSFPAFETRIRIMYISPKEIFLENFPRRGISGAFNQYAAVNLNSFRKNTPGVETRGQIWDWPHIFSKYRVRYRKQRMLSSYRSPRLPSKMFTSKLMTSYLFGWNFGAKSFPMNIRCLSSLFHPPTFLVLTAPHIKRVVSRKAGPPAGLPIYGEEGAMDRFN